MSYYASQQQGGMTLKKSKRIRGKLVLLGILIIIVIIAAGVFFALKGGIHVFNRPISAFTIGSDTTQLEKNTFKNSADIAQGNVLRLQMRYDTSKVTEIKIKLYGSDGQIAVDAGTYKVGQSGDFSVAMSTESLKPGDYTAKVSDQSDKQIYEGKVKITERKNEE